MDLTFLGHACFLLTSESGKKIIIDPFIQGNPLAPMQVAEIKVDLVVVTHGHADHLGDAVAIAQDSDCPIVSMVELCNYCHSQGAKVHGMQIGGSYNFGFVDIKLTLALHSSSIGHHPAQYLGSPVGVILTMDDQTVYHAGDTALFGDMALIGRLHPLDVALLPIGDNFTMGPADSIEAVQMLQPKVVIPMHYNTWEIINQDVAAFCQQVTFKTKTAPVALAPGEIYTIPKKA